MTDLYTVQISLQQRVGRDCTVRVWASETGAAEERREDFGFTVLQEEEPEDLRDWLRRALAAVIEAI